MNRLGLRVEGVEFQVFGFRSQVSGSGLRAPATWCRVYCSELQGFCVSGVLRFRGSEFQGVRVAGVQSFRGPEFQGFRVSGERHHAIVVVPGGDHDCGVLPPACRRLHVVDLIRGACPLWFMVDGLWRMVYGVCFMFHVLCFMVYGLWRTGESLCRFLNSGSDASAEP